jgi:hypothetical protein
VLGSKWRRPRMAMPCGLAGRLANVSADAAEAGDEEILPRQDD